MWTECVKCGKKINIKKGAEQICSDCLKEEVPVNVEVEIVTEYRAIRNCWISDKHYVQGDIVEDIDYAYIELGLFEEA